MRKSIVGIAFSAFVLASPAAALACDHNPPPPPPAATPLGGIGGPCADPAYFGIFDNSQMDTATTYRFAWIRGHNHPRSVIKVLPPHTAYATWEHWAKPRTNMTVDYLDSDGVTWINLQTETARRGNHPPCVYKHGWLATDPPEKE